MHDDTIIFYVQLLIICQNNIIFTIHESSLLNKINKWLNTNNKDKLFVFGNELRSLNVEFFKFSKILLKCSAFV